MYSKRAVVTRPCQTPGGGSCVCERAHHYSRYAMRDSLIETQALQFDIALYNLFRGDIETISTGRTAVSVGESDKLPESSLATRARTRIGDQRELPHHKCLRWSNGSEDVAAVDRLYSGGEQT